MALDRFIRERITGPLKMTDTDFFPPHAKRGRLTAVYTHDATGKLVRAPDGPPGQGDYIEGPRRTFSGGAGLTSTARDYGRFLQMLLNQGELDGVRILGPRTVALMTTNQVGTLFAWQADRAGDRELSGKPAGRGAGDRRPQPFDRRGDHGRDRRAVRSRMHQAVQGGR